MVLPVDPLLTGGSHLIAKNGKRHNSASTQNPSPANSVAQFWSTTQLCNHCYKIGCLEIAQGNSCVRKKLCGKLLQSVGGLLKPCCNKDRTGNFKLPLLPNLLSGHVINERSQTRPGYLVGRR
jgi:hypothetical protein